MLVRVGPLEAEDGKARVIIRGRREGVEPEPCGKAEGLAAVGIVDGQMGEPCGAMGGEDGAGSELGAERAKRQVRLAGVGAGPDDGLGKDALIEESGNGRKRTGSDLAGDGLGGGGKEVVISEGKEVLPGSGIGLVDGKNREKGKGSAMEPGGLQGNGDRAQSGEERGTGEGGIVAWRSGGTEAKGTLIGRQGEVEHGRRLVGFGIGEQRALGRGRALRRRAGAEVVEVQGIPFGDTGGGPIRALVRGTAIDLVSTRVGEELANRRGGGEAEKALGMVGAEGEAAAMEEKRGGLLIGPLEGKGGP